MSGDESIPLPPIFPCYPPSPTTHNTLPPTIPYHPPSPTNYRPVPPTIHRPLPPTIPYHPPIQITSNKFLELRRKHGTNLSELGKGQLASVLKGKEETIGTKFSKLRERQNRYQAITATKETSWYQVLKAKKETVGIKFSRLRKRHDSLSYSKLISPFFYICSPALEPC